MVSAAKKSLHGITLVILLLLVAVGVSKFRWELELRERRATIPPTPTAFASVPVAPASPVPSSSAEAARHGEQGKVARVFDGDSIQLADGRVVRYIGIDAPETAHARPAAECYAQEATERNRSLVEGQTVRLDPDTSERDRYGRLLRYVYVGDRFVNELLVRDGFAVARTYRPDVRHHDRFRVAEAEARAAHRGLWGVGCARTP